MCFIKVILVLKTDRLTDLSIEAENLIFKLRREASGFYTSLCVLVIPLGGTSICLSKIF